MSAPLGVTNNNGGSAQGSALSAEQVLRILVQPLQERSVFLSSGVTTYDGNGSPVRIPKQAPPLGPLAFVGENEEIPSVSPEFGELTLLPSGMKGVKCLTKFSEELARQSVIALDAALQSRLVTDVAATLDSVLIASSVTDGSQPTGLLHYAGVQSMDIGSAALTVDDLHDAWGMAAGAFVNLAALRWFIRSETFTALRKLKASGTGNYLLQPDPTQANVYLLLGIPVTVTNRLPITGTDTHVTQAVLADFSQIAVARDMAPSVRVLSERFADLGQVAIRVEARYDAGPVNPQAVVRLDNVLVP